MGLASSGLGHKVGVRQEGAGHTHHVGLAAGQYFFCHLGRIDAVGGHQRNLHLALELLGHPGKGRAWHLGGDGGDTRFVPADAGVQDSDTCRFQRLRELHHFFFRRSAFHQVQHGQAEDQDEVGPHAGPGAAHDLQRETNAVFITATPGVVALVGLARDELVDQVALGAHDLHTVVARALRQRGSVGVVLNGLLHFLGGQRVRAEGADGCLQRTGRHQLGVVGVAAKVQDLHANLAACGVHRLGHHLVFVGFLLRGHGRAAGHRAGAVVGCNTPGHDQADAAFGALGVESGHAGEAVTGLFQAHMHGAHEHAVFEGGKAQVQRAQHMGVGSGGNGHGAVSL